MVFILAIYSFFFSSHSPLMASRAYVPSAWGENLKNRMIFAFAFVEMFAWFWAFVKLRDERREMAIHIAEKRAAEENNM